MISPQHLRHRPGSTARRWRCCIQRLWLHHQQVMQRSGSIVITAGSLDGMGPCDVAHKPLP